MASLFYSPTDTDYTHVGMPVMLYCILHITWPSKTCILHTIPPNLHPSETPHYLFPKVTSRDPPPFKVHLSFVFTAAFVASEYASIKAPPVSFFL